MMRVSFSKQSVMSGFFVGRGMHRCACSSYFLRQKSVFG